MVASASLEDITDSTDWLNSSLSSFAPLESALRCQVCKDFFKAPMITSCSHTFCSLCIRRCLSSEKTPECPACRAKDQSSKLRPNFAIQELVEAFQNARPAAMELATKDLQEEARLREENPRKRKRRVEKGDFIEGEPPRPMRQTRSSSQRDGQRSVPTSQDVIMVADSEDEADEEYQPEPEDGLVPCPMCNKRMKEELVFSHLDVCGSENYTSRRQSKPRTPPQAAPKVPLKPVSPSKRLSHLNYNFLKDNALKKKLQELGIPAWGSRQLMIRRHTQWVDIFNANGDMASPRSNSQLLKDLDIWERTQGGNAQLQQNAGTNVMQNDFDEQEWQGRYTTHFQDLVANARAKIQKTNVDTESEEPKVNGESGTPTGDKELVIGKTGLNEESTSIARSQPIHGSFSVSPFTTQEIQLPHDPPPTSCSQAHSLQINGTSPSSQQTRRMSDSLPANFTSQDHIRKMSMFQVPDDNHNDID